MPIYYAGYSLLIDQPTEAPGHSSDENCELVQIVQSWLDRFSPLDQMNLFGSRPVALNDGNLLPGCPAKKSVGLTAPNWTEAPPLRLNTLYWPCTGATRWARFVGLVDEPTLDKIIANLTLSAFDPDNRHGALWLWEGDSHRKRIISPVMYLLPPRKITVDARAGTVKLWLLPLVDERYMWQFFHVGQNVPGHASNTTWATWLAALGAQQGAPVTGAGFDMDAISADYFKPDALSFGTIYENLPVVLDAAAESLGMRIVRDFDGKVYFMNYSRSAQRLQDSLAPSGDLSESGYEIIVGGKADKHNQFKVPSNLSVLFPYWWDSGAYHQIGYTWNGADMLDPATLAFTGVKVIYSTAQAQISVPSPAVVNTADLGTLSKKIAQDYYNWQKEQYDYTFLGVKKWKPHGYDDWYICQMASNHPGGEPLTRVTSHPPDLGTSCQYQAFSFTGSHGMFQASYGSTNLSGSAAGSLNTSTTEGDNIGFLFDVVNQTVYSAGFYKVTLTGALRAVAGGLSTDGIQLMIDTTGAFVAIPDFKLYFGTPDASADTADEGYQVFSMTRIVRVEAGNKLKVNYVNGNSVAHQVLNANLVISDGS